jgi:hypothetical protein
MGLIECIVRISVSSEPVNEKVSEEIIFLQILKMDRNSKIIVVTQQQLPGVSQQPNAVQVFANYGYTATGTTILAQPPLPIAQPTPHQSSYHPSY